MCVLQSKRAFLFSGQTIRVQVLQLAHGLKWEGLGLCGKFVDLVKVVPVSFGGEILVFEQIRKMRCQVSKFTEEGEVA